MARGQWVSGCRKWYPIPILSGLFFQHEAFIDYAFTEEIFLYSRELEGFHLSWNPTKKCKGEVQTGIRTPRVGWETDCAVVMCLPSCVKSWLQSWLGVGFMASMVFSFAVFELMFTMHTPQQPEGWAWYGNGGLMCAKHKEPSEKRTISIQ